MVNYARKLLQSFGIKPDLPLNNPDSEITQIYHKANSTELFFIVNRSNKKDHTISFFHPFPGKNAQLWDTQTGKKYTLEAENKSFEWTLPTASSMLLIFDKKTPKRRC